MKIGLTVELNKETTVRRATADDWDGYQQVALWWSAEAGYSSVTLFAPSVEAADALVAAFILCGAVKQCGIPAATNREVA